MKVIESSKIIGEIGDACYILEKGSAIAYTSKHKDLFIDQQKVGEDSVFINKIDAGCVFGDIALLYECERTATIKTLEESIVNQSKWK